MLESINFTKTRLDKLEPAEAGKRIAYGDAKKPKLVLRITDKGTKTFYVVKKVAGKTKWVTIGRWPETSVDKARKAVDDILSDLNKGIDPIDKKRAQQLKQLALGELLEKYLSDRELKDSTKKDYRIKFNRGFGDWKKKPASKITPSMVMQRHKKISKSGKTTANTTMRVLRLLMRYGKAIGAVDSVPTDILNSARLWHKNKRKANIIPSDDLQNWYQAVESLLDIKSQIYFTLLLYTGLRHQEGLSLLWEDIDWQENTLIVRNTKNHLDHKLPIAKPLLPLLKKLRNETAKTAWLFPNPKGTAQLSEAPRSALKSIKDNSVPFSVHDLRRTFATIAEAVYIPQTIIKKLLNHVTDNDVTGGYIRTEMKTLHDAVNKIASFITTKVSTKSNIIVLKRHSNEK